MQSASSPARQARSHYRHELRTLTYITLDEANGGVIRNLNHEGMSIQAVAALRHEQRIRLRFELRFPRLRVDAYGQVSWSKPSGQCGIRFTDLSPRVSSQIDQWIFSNLLDSVARETTHSRSIFEDSVISISRQERETEQIDGLTLSAPPHPVIPRSACRSRPAPCASAGTAAARALGLGEFLRKRCQARLAEGNAAVGVQHPVAQTAWRRKHEGSERSADSTQLGAHRSRKAVHDGARLRQRCY